MRYFLLLNLKVLDMLLLRVQLPQLLLNSCFLIKTGNGTYFNLG